MSFNEADWLSRYRYLLNGCWASLPVFTALQEIYGADQAYWNSLPGRFSNIASKAKLSKEFYDGLQSQQQQRFEFQLNRMQWTNGLESPEVAHGYLEWLLFAIDKLRTHEANETKANQEEKNRLEAKRVQRQKDLEKELKDTKAALAKARRAPATIPVSTSASTTQHRTNAGPSTPSITTNYTSNSGNKGRPRYNITGNQSKTMPQQSTHPNAQAISHASTSGSTSRPASRPASTFGIGSFVPNVNTQYMNEVAERVVDGEELQDKKDKAAKDRAIQKEADRVLAMKKEARRKQQQKDADATNARKGI